MNEPEQDENRIEINNAVSLSKSADYLMGMVAKAIQDVGQLQAANEKLIELLKLARQERDDLQAELDTRDAQVEKNIAPKEK